MKNKKLNRKTSCIVLMLLILCISNLSAEPCGDVNSDDSINIVDALLIAQYYVGIIPEVFDENAADVNADESINIVDALLIAQLYVGLIPELPGCDQTPEPTPSPTPDEQPTDPPQLIDCSETPVWSPDEIYDTEGMSVQYNNNLYENNWYSQNQKPEENSGEHEVWTLIGECDSEITPAPATPTPTPDLTETPDPTVTPEGYTPGPGRFIDTYQPEESDRADAWNNYINNEIEALTVGTGGNGGNKTITNTILVLQGTTYDGQGERITAQGMGDGSQDEGQQPFFLLEPGANLKNVTFTAPGVEGVHMMGDNVLENIVWEDVGEDAASVRSYFPGGFIHLINCSASDAADKIFQFNRSCIVWFEHVTGSNMGKFIRTNNGWYFPFEFYLDNCSVSGVNNCIMKVNRDDHTVYLYNFSGSGDWEGGITLIEYGGGGPDNKP